MLAMKYAEFMMSNKLVTKVTTERVEYFRHKLACKLYYHTLQKEEPKLTKRSDPISRRKTMIYIVDMF